MHCEWVVFKIKRTCSLLQRAVNSAILHRLVNNTGINSIENFCFLNSVGVHHHTVEFFCWEVLIFSWLPGVMHIVNCEVSKKIEYLIQKYSNLFVRGPDCRTDYWKKEGRNSRDIFSGSFILTCCRNHDAICKFFLNFIKSSK